MHHHHQSEEGAGPSAHARFSGTSPAAGRGKLRAGKQASKTKNDKGPIMDADGENLTNSTMNEVERCGAAQKDCSLWCHWFLVDKLLTSLLVLLAVFVGRVVLRAVITRLFCVRRLSRVHMHRHERTSERKSICELELVCWCHHYERLLILHRVSRVFAHTEHADCSLPTTA